VEYSPLKRLYDLFRAVRGLPTTDYRELRSKFWTQMSQNWQILQRFLRIRIVHRSIAARLVETAVANVRPGNTAFEEETLS